ncbi:MAG: hypothetical protein COX34_01805 [Candidatus Nealsonbacteria bacterium CG23_combo_of_CG06-09_8_20_14_all_36_12]|uniref:Peptidase C39 domain-containing protein n=1 Tax=Candidatus Nealsonbacteria bacterium CG23_combo_of_CG06-09_8_20_14_all_36_12 TaxID=1974718 RepID=A0A2G9Z068_9BACT|nr:MAG: hypothetical protein COX34_01805 [Candidatus Nealsonbacteria bacterium CG23_combo_of_CG06-09_8_20_14_all_36_12]
MKSELKVLPVKPFQETLCRGYCGPASLKMVFEYYGVRKSEKELAEILKCETKRGTNDRSIKEVAENLGFNVEIKNNASFGDVQVWLDKKVPVIVDWFSRGRHDYPEDNVADGHYSVVVGLDDEFIFLQDPEVGRMRKIKRDDFFSVWFDFSADYIEKCEDLILRQLIAIYR